MERILRDKKPKGFLLENVEGLITHDRENSKDKIGRTFKTILSSLAALGYMVSWKVLNAKDFGIPQDRKRIYIIGIKTTAPRITSPAKKVAVLQDVLESGLDVSNSNFVNLLLSRYSPEELCGKSIKDKRGGKDNIHSWDIEAKGPVSETQKKLLNEMLKERRKKKWAEEYGIDWMDGMPLTLEQIKTFYDCENLKEILEDLVKKKYIKMEHPKKKVGNSRKQDKNLPLGYNIVTGKMSFEVNKILDPHGYAPTLVAMDMKGLYVIDNGGLRNLSLREGLRLFGYLDNYKFNIEKELGYDLLGNTVVVPVITFVSDCLLNSIKISELSSNKTIQNGRTNDEIAVIRRVI